VDEEVEGRHRGSAWTAARCGVADDDSAWWSGPLFSS
jgi:hypothetical protein